jgi:hypothetical protein
MLIPQLLRTLHVLPTHHPRGQPHLSAASGLVCIAAQGRFQAYVVADDEHHLGCFSIEDDQPVQLLRLFAGDLPEKPKQRKRLKPDLESLTTLPATPGYPHGALLALGSGSKELRHKGLLMPLNAQGLLPDEAVFTPQQIDLTAWYAPLHAEFEDLNIEGCFIQDDQLHLMQRGNKGDSPSACISYKLADVQAWLTDGELAPQPQQIRRIDLGQINGVPLTPTDALALPNGRWLMSAVAEDTTDSAQDGACVGSALVLLNADAEVLRIQWIKGSPKVEGISLIHFGAVDHVLMVTDADNPEQASQLLRLDISQL